MENYIIVDGMTIEQLQKEVNKAIAVGYVVQGSMSFVMTDEFQRFYQPMVLQGYEK